MRSILLAGKFTLKSEDISFGVFALRFLVSLCNAVFTVSLCKAPHFRTVVKFNLRFLGLFGFVRVDLLRTRLQR